MARTQDPMTRMNCTMPASTLRKLEELAEADDRPRTSVIRRLIEAAHAELSQNVLVDPPGEYDPTDGPF